jgi:C1A family cysteine protease
MNHNLKHYQGGVFDDPECCTNNNHAPFLVGYGTDPEFGDYWIMKNSYGPGWGENGYARIARNKGNMCNIAREALVRFWKGF